jgi:hypothetical protein
MTIGLMLLTVFVFFLHYGRIMKWNCKGKCSWLLSSRALAFSASQNACMHHACYHICEGDASGSGSLLFVLFDLLLSLARDEAIWQSLKL